MKIEDGKLLVVCSPSGASLACVPFVAFLAAACSSSDSGGTDASVDTDADTDTDTDTDTDAGADTDTDTDTDSDTDTETDSDTDTGADAGSDAGSEVCTISEPIYDWHTFYGSMNSDVSYSVAVDGNGNVVVVGNSSASWIGPGGESPLYVYPDDVYSNFFVLKLDQSGAYQWHAFFGTANYEMAYSVAVDGSNSIYIVGDSFNSWNGPGGESPLHAHAEGSASGTDVVDFFVLKLGSNGDYEWHTFYGPASGSSVAVDESNGVYVTGGSAAAWTGPGGESPLHPHVEEEYPSGDIFILKLDSDGEYQWHTFFGSSYSDFGNAVAVDDSGDTYVTGAAGDTWIGPEEESPLHAHSGVDNGDAFILKMDPSGVYEWHTFMGASYFSDMGRAIAVDSSCNVYLSGESDGTWVGPGGESPLHAHTEGEYNSVDIFVLKLNTSGEYQWHAFYGASGENYTDPGDDSAWLDIDCSGNVFVAGYSGGAWTGPGGEGPLQAFSGAQDAFLLGLDASGVYQWHTFYGSFTWDGGLSVTVDWNGDTYITGSAESTWTGPGGESPLHAHTGDADYLEDFFVLKLTQ